MQALQVAACPFCQQVYAATSPTGSCSACPLYSHLATCSRRPKEVSRQAAFSALLAGAGLPGFSSRDLTASQDPEATQPAAGQFAGGESARDPPRRRRRGNACQRRADAFGALEAFDWATLDTISDQELLGAPVSGKPIICPAELSADHNAAVAFGLRYFLEHHGDATDRRGLAWIHLVEMLTLSSTPGMAPPHVGSARRMLRRIVDGGLLEAWTERQRVADAHAQEQARKAALDAANPATAPPRYSGGV